MKKTILYALVITLFVVSCAQNVNPQFIKDKVKAEPSFLKPTDGNHNQLILYYNLKNPTNIDFPGKVSYKYDENCLTLDSKETKVSIPVNKREDSYSVNVRPRNYNLNFGVRDYDDKCYGTQSILLVLSNNEGTVVYDSVSVEISVTR